MYEDKSSEKSNEYRNIGNDFFRKGHYYEALKFYNTALARADSSEEISLAIANRSAVYFELKMYENSFSEILTIDLTTYPLDKISKIIKRHDACLKILNEQGKLEFPLLDLAEDFIKLSYPANPKIPYIAHCLELKTDGVFGRGIFATRDLNPGDIIAIEKIRISHILEAADERCCICLKTSSLHLFNQDTKDCILTCSNDCSVQKDALATYFGGGIMSLDKVRLDLKLPEENHYDAIKINKRKLKTIFNYDWSNMSEEEYDSAYLKCFYGLHCRFPQQNVKSQHYYVRLSGVMMTSKVLLNFYDVRNDGQMAFNQAECYLPFGSLLNHSCDPNVMKFEFDTNMVFYVAKPIKKGEELFISYLSDLGFFGNCRENRREMLSKKFYFTCQCTSCELDYSSIAETEFLTPKDIKKMTVEEALQEFKENNNMLKIDFEDYRDEKAQYLIHRNVRLMHLVSAYQILPFKN